MERTINQAVVFTKPLHHAEGALTSEQLDRQARSFLEEQNMTNGISKM